MVFEVSRRSLLSSVGVTAIGTVPVAGQSKGASSNKTVVIAPPSTPLEFESKVADYVRGIEIFSLQDGRWKIIRDKSEQLQVDPKAEKIVNRQLSSSIDTFDNYEPPGGGGEPIVDLNQSEETIEYANWGTAESDNCGAETAYSVGDIGKCTGVAWNLIGNEQCNGNSKAGANFGVIGDEPAFVTVSFSGHLQGLITASGGASGEFSLDIVVENRDTGAEYRKNVKSHSTDLWGYKWYHENISPSITAELDPDDDYRAFLELDITAEVTGIGEVTVDFGPQDNDEGHVKFDTIEFSM